MVHSMLWGAEGHHGNELVQQFLYAQINRPYAIVSNLSNWTRLPVSFIRLVKLSFVLENGSQIFVFRCQKAKSKIILWAEKSRPPMLKLREKNCDFKLRFITPSLFDVLLSSSPSAQMTQSIETSFSSSRKQNYQILKLKKESLNRNDAHCSKFGKCQTRNY